ncbi:MAG: hypothetical protein ACREF3_08845 [Acetobacteraceae bacterium]
MGTTADGGKVPLRDADNVNRQHMVLPTPPRGVAATVVIIVVGFRNPDDVLNCVRALAAAEGKPSFEIFIAENGGSDATELLIAHLLAAGPHCRHASLDDLPIWPQPARHRARLRWEGAQGEFRMWINIAEMPQNLGYAGGVNGWLRPLLEVPGWQGAWVLNPDTEPTPTALAELVAYAAQRGKGMVGGRLLVTSESQVVHSRGLIWRKLVAKTGAVDYQAPVTVVPDPDEVDPRIDAPSGASVYVTRDLIDAIGLMDERYFLYFEDLEWGYRAKPYGGVGYAHASIIPHKGHTTVRSKEGDGGPSNLTVYLEFRNRILFVRKEHPRWLLWTVLMQIIHVGALTLRGSASLGVFALRGLAAGLRNETGRPDHIIASSK